MGAGHNYEVALGDKCHPWTTDSQLFATPGNFSAVFHYCFIFRICILTFGLSQFWHLQCSSVFPFQHIYPFNIDNCDGIKVWNMLSSATPEAQAWLQGLLCHEKYPEFAIGPQQIRHTSRMGHKSIW